jgi:hypothetical protein
MRIIFNHIFLLLSVLCFLSPSYAVENYENGNETSFVDQVITNERGVCLLIDGSWLIADGFQCSSEGMFVFVHETWVPLTDAIEISDFQASWRCSKCKRYNMDGVNVCPYCGKSKSG